MLTFLKLGGSLITDKCVEASFQEVVTRRLADEIQAALNENPDLNLVI